MLPTRKTKTDKVVILCDGMPSVPERRKLTSFLSKKGFWVIHMRYRGVWESEGEFLKDSPAADVSLIIDELPKGLTEVAFEKHFELKPEKIYVMGSSFGGTTALMASLDPHVDKAISISPVARWKGLSDAAETSKDYVAYLRDAFGPAYRFKEKNWRRLYSDPFFDPLSHWKEFDRERVMMFHAKDDPVVSWKPTAELAKKSGLKLKLFARGSHLSATRTIIGQWRTIKNFLES